MAQETLFPIEAAIKTDHRKSPEARSRIAEFNARTKRKYPKEFDSHSRLHTIWRAMTFRCYHPSHEAYPRYGGRGITICDAWRNDYAAFIKWALENGYTDDLTIDRRDNDLGYTPDNCRWRTMKQQNSNRRNNVAVTAFGETKIISEWCVDSRCRVGRVGLYQRLRAGENPETAITRESERPVAPELVFITAFGESKSPPDWASDPRCKVELATIYWRQRRGWGGEVLLTKPARAMRSPDATHCTKGHAFTPQNTKIDTSGSRRCRQCNQDKERARKRRTK